MFFSNTTQFTQRIGQHVARGFHFWTSGHAQGLASFKNLERKFADEYFTEMTHGQRSWRQARKAGNAHLLGVQEKDERVFWILLLSDGEHPAKEVIIEKGIKRMREKLHNANEHRIQYRDYELIHATRANISGGGSSWTWFFTHESEQGIARAFAKVCQQGYASEVTKHVAMLSNYIMHRGVRGQLQKVIRRGQTLFAKHGHGQEWPALQPNELPKMGSFKKTKVEDALA